MIRARVRPRYVEEQPLQHSLALRAVHVLEHLGRVRLDCVLEPAHVSEVI